MSILQSKFRLMIALLAGVFALATPSLAIPVSGSLSIGGSSAEVGATFLNFVCNNALTASCPAGYGNFVVSAPVSGSFVPYNGDTGFIRNLSQATAPINQTFSLPNFVIFDPAGTVVPPDIALDLTFIFTGVGGQAQCGLAPAPGQTCTPAGIPGLITASNPLGLSPFTLANTQVGSSATFSVAGTARRISTGEVSTFTGVFTAQFNEFFQEYLGTIASGGTITNSYSATFEATLIPIPEATSITLLVGGLLLIGGLIRRRM
ncbi:MAG TPA: hypothetical protein VFR18_05315 [Terriglobia bacterium]|nr:hypothetical protein [Terriglobia bacterium]